jgi:hypothetical protein
MFLATMSAFIPTRYETISLFPCKAAWDEKTLARQERSPSWKADSHSAV